MNVLKMAAYIGKVKRVNTILLVCLFICISIKRFVHWSLLFFFFFFQVILVFVLSIGSLIIYFINSSEWVKSSMSLGCQLSLNFLSGIMFNMLSDIHSYKLIKKKVSVPPLSTKSSFTRKCMTFSCILSSCIARGCGAVHTSILESPRLEASSCGLHPWTTYEDVLCLWNP